MTTATPLAPVQDDEGHDCIEHVDGRGQCTECGEHLPVGELACTWCNRFPCICDEAYERARDERMGF